MNEERFSLCVRHGEQGLYDHHADPDLEHDLSAEHPEVVERLSAARQRWPEESARERTARTSTHKLVERPLLEGGYQRSLYVLPDDTTDVSASHPDIVAELVGALDAWGAPRPDQVERGEQDLEALRSLGYVE